MSWISEKLFGKRRSYEEQLCCNLYDALVLSGGPSAEAEQQIDDIALGIPIGKLERFASKRLIMLEAFLFVAVNIATMPRQDEDGPLFNPVHPLAVQMATRLQTKWAERGIEVRDHIAVGERCFAEVSDVLDKPFKWGRAWLEEFYDSPEKTGEHYILWTEQCLKEFQAMKMVVEQNV